MPDADTAGDGASAKLAIDGGTPIRDTWLPYGRQIVDDDDVAAVEKVLRSEWLTTGPSVDDFERAVADFVGARSAVAVSSGTAALHAAVNAAGIGPGCEVIVPAMTFVASANCARFEGADVVFADVRPDTLNLDPASVESVLSDRTRAILTVDYGGQPSDLDELRSIADARGLVLIEDASHAIGATYRGRRVGSIADLTTFSLHPVKQLTAGEGGLITTNDERYVDRLRSFRSHGIAADVHRREAEGTWFYEMTALGYNYRISDFQCALARSQLRKLPEWLRRRREIVARYTETLASIEVFRPLAILPDRESAWHLYVIQVDTDRLDATRGDVFRAMRAENIGVNVHYIPVPWHPYYRTRGGGRGRWPVAEAAYEKILTLPLWAGMSIADADDVVAALAKVHRAYGV